MDIALFETIDSTNAEARRRAQNGQGTPMLILAETQTGGRGRMGRNFFSPFGTGLYMTYLWQPGMTVVDVISVTTAVSVAVHRALCAVPGVVPEKLGIKWVNDLYYSEKKVCGILTEAITNPEHGLVEQMWVGIGINVAPMAFPAELADIAASLDIEIDRSLLAASIVKELRALLEANVPYSHMSYYREHSLVIGKHVDLIRGEIVTPVTVTDISCDGGLVVRYLDGTVETIHSGEVSLRI